MTLYDLIPEIFAERYLADPGLRRRYRARLELVRAADVVLAISETTARDAVELLAHSRRADRRGGRGRVGATTRGPAVDGRSAGRGARRGRRARGAVRALHRGNGRPEELPGPVPRVVAPAGAGPRRVAARDGVQHGRSDAQPPRAPRARSRASSRGCCCPASFPTRCCACSTSRPTCSCSRRSTRATGCRSRKRSRAARARSARARRRWRSCSCPRRSSIRPTTTRWRPRSSARSPTTRLQRVARRAGPRGRCRAGTRSPTASPTCTSGCSRAPRPPARRRPLVAVVTPLPPAASGVADYSYRLLEALREHCDVHAFADGRRCVDPRARSAARARRGRGAARCGASLEQERGARRLRLRRVLPRQQPVPRGRARAAPAAVGHRARARGAAHRPLRVERRRAGRGARRVRGVPRRDVRRASRPGPGASGRLAPDEAERLGVLMAAEVGGARRSLRRDVGVRGRSGAARCAARRRRSHLRRSVRDARSGDRRDAGRRPRAADRELRRRQRGQAVRAARRGVARRCSRGVPDAQLAFVGPCADADREELAALAAALGVARARDRDRRGHRPPSTRRGSTAPRSRCSSGAPRTASRRRRSPTASPPVRCSSSPASAPAATCPTRQSCAVSPDVSARRAGRRSSPICSTIPTAGPRSPAAGA